MDADPLQGLEFRAVDTQSWPDLERLFEARGGPKYCWCMVFRAAPAEGRLSDNASRKAALEARVRDGLPVGLLAYLQAAPIAWCSIAPKATFPRLRTPSAAREERDDGAPVWSLSCFYVARRFRGLGMTRRLIEAALAHARDHGARVVEAYPVEPDSPSYRFMGFTPTFEAAGFREVGRLGKRRRVMRRRLAEPRSPDPL